MAPIVAPRLVRVYNYIKGSNPIDPDMLRAMITMIPKPGKDHQNWTNFPPISLLNIDLKILTKILANRVNEFLGDEIHRDQKEEETIWKESTNKKEAMNVTASMNLSNQNDFSGPDDDSNEDWPIHFAIAAVVALILCLIGLVGNIIVFWYLGFKIERNKYTVYIINLSVADGLFIIFSSLLLMVFTNTFIGRYPNFNGKDSFFLFIEIFYDTMQYSGMYILTAISMERCISVLFPLWYQSHRPKNLSTIICSSLWAFSFLESILGNFLCTPEAFATPTAECTAIQIIIFVLSIGICLPIMVTSSLTLLIKIKRTFRHQYTPKLYIIIIIAVLVFILSVVPFNILWFLMYFGMLPSDIEMTALFFASEYCLLLNCTVDPYIYFIVGKKWKEKHHHSIQNVLQRAFTEEDENDDLKSNKSNETNVTVVS
ncbi:mas-related G-protein coupled receptor member H-like [Gastrophryne carolinensis]